MMKALGACSVMLVAAMLCGEASAQPAPGPTPAPGQPPPAPVEVPPATPPAQVSPGAGAAPSDDAVAAPPPAGATTAPSARSPLDVPPPPPGSAEGTTPPPPPPPVRAFANEAGSLRSAGGDGPPLAGWHGRFFLRDKDDHFRLYPGGMVQVDFQAWAGPGVDGSARSAGGAGLPPRFIFRRGRIALAGEILKRWSFLLQLDAGIPSRTPEGDARLGEVVSPEFRVQPGNIWLDYGLCDCLHLTFGQVRAPVGLENRTSIATLPLFERSIATRGWIAPRDRETGIMLWGDLFDDLLSYELMVAGGDGNNRPQVDGRFDFMGRVLVRPFQSIEAIERTHLGIAARHGDRDQFGVGYDVPAIVTAQGLDIGAPTYRDAQARLIHVLPSGAQNQIGGELRVPVGPIDVRGELHYVANNTREAVDGFQLSRTNAERLGHLTGWGTTGAVTWWALGDEMISGEPLMRPATVNLKKKPELRRGLAVTAAASAIVAEYDATARGGELDPGTPGGRDNPATAIDVVQLAGNVSYWHTRYVRLGVELSHYLTGGAADNQVRVPGNQGDEADPDAGSVTEIGSRIQILF